MTFNDGLRSFCTLSVFGFAGGPGTSSNTGVKAPLSAFQAYQLWSS